MTRTTAEVFATELPGGEMCLGHTAVDAPRDTIQSVRDAMPEKDDIEAYDDNETVAVIEFADGEITDIKFE